MTVSLVGYGPTPFNDPDTSAGQGDSANTQQEAAVKRDNVASRQQMNQQPSNATPGGPRVNQRTQGPSFQDPQGSPATGGDKRNNPAGIRSVTSRTPTAKVLTYQRAPTSSVAAPLSHASPAGGRVKRQTPSPVEQNEQTRQAYATSAARSDGITIRQLEAATGQPDSLPAHCVGLAFANMHVLFDGQAHDLMGATNVTYQRLRDPATRESTLLDIHCLQDIAEYGPPGNAPGYEIRGDGRPRDGKGTVEDLREHFSTPQPSRDGVGTLQDRFAYLGLQLDEDKGHVVLIQHVNPSADYRNDEYQLYDSNQGTFSYRGFEALATAVNRLYTDGYKAYGGIEGIETFYFGDTSTLQPYPGFDPEFERAMLNARLDVYAPEWVPVPSQTDPTQLPPLPDFDQPGPSGWDGGRHTELKRSTGADSPDHPFALFRPSQTSPDELRKQQGFSVADTQLRNVSLDLHDAIMAGNPAATDGGGYVGTFTARDQAQARIDATDKKEGYIYYVAPSPNMVDVPGSLGSEHALDPHNGEVAAMGHIDYTQIRGWQKYGNGKLEQYVANPDYRYDIYDQTRTAGKQPQLASFSPDNPAWADADHRPFVTPFQQDGKTLYRPNENPALAQARFYQHANADIQQRVNDQAHHLDYQGPVTIWPAWGGNNGASHPVRLNFTAGYPSIDRSAANSGGDQFRMDDDGRIHLASDNNKVLRIDGNGNAYIGSNPGSNSLNGVFVHDPRSGALIHAEDGKLLTEGAFAYTPFVETPQGRSGLLQRQSWTFSDSSGNTVQPPVPLAAFRNSTAGSPEQLYRFYDNPDSALPDGTSHFVTSVPGVKSHDGDNFMFYPDHIAQGDAAAARKWLAGHNAAWLFKDGFYAVASGPDTLEVRTLGGTPVWRARIDPATGHETYAILQNDISSNYDTPSRTWQRMLDNEKRDGTLYQQTGQKYM